jgi:hypothetical protein
MNLAFRYVAGSLRATSDARDEYTVVETDPVNSSLAVDLRAD